VGIIRTRWNEEHVGNLVDGCKKALLECKVKDENIFETSVPGCYELPLAARFLALSGTVDAIVTAGVLIKGDVSTTGFLYLCFRRFFSSLFRWHIRSRVLFPILFLHLILIFHEICLDFDRFISFHSFRLCILNTFPVRSLLV
jgi:hypothetical protein